MNRAERAGRILLTAVLAGTVIAVFGFQWNATHLFHPNWHPHSKLHLVQLMALVTAMAGLGLWLLWREPAQARTGAIVATVAPVVFWGGEFAALLVPGTSPAFDLKHPNTIELGFVPPIYGNLLFSGVMIAMAGAGYLLIRRGLRHGVNRA